MVVVAVGAVDPGEEGAMASSVSFVPSSSSLSLTSCLLLLSPKCLPHPAT